MPTWNRTPGNDEDNYSPLDAPISFEASGRESILAQRLTEMTCAHAAEHYRRICAQREMQEAQDEAHAMREAFAKMFASEQHALRALDIKREESEREISLLRAVNNELREELRQTRDEREHYALLVHPHLLPINPDK